MNHYWRIVVGCGLLSVVLGCASTTSSVRPNAADKNLLSTVREIHVRFNFDDKADRDWQDYIKTHIRVGFDDKTYHDWQNLVKLRLLQTAQAKFREKGVQLLTEETSRDTLPMLATIIRVDLQRGSMVARSLNGEKPYDPWYHMMAEFRVEFLVGAAGASHVVFRDRSETNFQDWTQMDPLMDTYSKMLDELISSFPK